MAVTADFLIQALEWATVLVTILLTLSGLPACINMYKTKSTENVPFLVFLVFAFVSVVCLQYSLLVENSALVAVNAFSLLAWIGYCSVYILVAKTKMDAFLKAIGMVFLYWGHLHYLSVIPKADWLPTLGVYMVFWCTVASLLPCTDIVEMVRSKSCSCCDMPMLYATTLSACVWIVYGITIHDDNVTISSLPGLLVNIVKFLLILKYPATASKPKKVDEEFNNNVKNESNDKVNTFHDEIYGVRSRNNNARK